MNEAEQRLRAKFKTATALSDVTNQVRRTRGVKRKTSESRNASKIPKRFSLGNTAAGTKVSSKGKQLLMSSIAKRTRLARKKTADGAEAKPKPRRRKSKKNVKMSKFFINQGDCAVASSVAKTKPVVSWSAAAEENAKVPTPPPSSDDIESPGIIDLCGSPRIRRLMEKSGYTFGASKMKDAKLGEGAFGAVFKAISRSKKHRAKQAVAVKFVEKHSKPSLEQNGTHFQELSKCRHILGHIGVVLEDKKLINGKPLCAVVLDLHPLGDLEGYARTNKLCTNDVLGATLDLCKATQFLHKMGWIHTDIKPLNILVKSTDPLSVCLSDLGECSTVQEVINDVHPYMTTVHYRAPEIILHKPQTEGSVFGIDKWSIGVVIARLVCGNVPFRASHGPGVLELISRTVGMPRPSWLTATIKSLPVENKDAFIRQFFTQLPCASFDYWTILPLPVGWKEERTSSTIWGDHYRYIKRQKLPPTPVPKGRTRHQRARPKKKQKKKKVSVKVERQTARPVPQSPSELPKDALPKGWKVEIENGQLWFVKEKLRYKEPPLWLAPWQMEPCFKVEGAVDETALNVLRSIIKGLLKWDALKRMELEDVIGVAEGVRSANKTLECD